MANLSDLEVARHLRAGGWPNKHLVGATAVVLGEHRGSVDPSVQSPPNSNGSIDYGLMSINSVHQDKLKTGNWKNPTDNARMGYMIFKEANNTFTPWTVWPAISALYQPRAVIAVRQLLKREPQAASTGSQEASQGGSEGGGAFTLHNALRAAMVAAGVVLLLVLLGGMLSESSVGSVVKQVATRGVVK